MKSLLSNGYKIDFQGIRPWSEITAREGPAKADAAIQIY
jgi:hypothetical protein